MFTCYFTADIEESPVHGQEKTDLLSTVNVGLIFNIFFCPRGWVSMCTGRIPDIDQVLWSLVRKAPSH